MKRLLPVVLLLGLSACGPTFHAESWSPGQPGLQLVENVPFRSQQARDDCGPAALSSLLAHRGVEISPETIQSELYLPALGGVLFPDLENFARRQGLQTRSGSGNPEFLRSEIDRGRPVLVLVETGFWEISRPHYLVVFGYTARSFLVHNGQVAGRFMDADAFDRRWAVMNRLYLVLE